MNGNDSPILGPYMRAMAIANQLRQMQWEQEAHRMEQERFNLYKQNIEQDNTRQRSLDLLELATKGIVPFKARTGSPEMERLFTPEQVVETPQGAYKVPTAKQRRKEKLDAYREELRSKKEIDQEFDPDVDIGPLLPENVRQLVGTLNVPKSALKSLVDDIIRGQKPEKPNFVSGYDPETKDLAYAYVTPQGPVASGTVRGVRRGTEASNKLSEGDRRRIAEQQLLGGKSPLVETEEYKSVSEQLKQALVESGDAADWTEAWKKADEIIRTNPRYKSIRRYEDIRKRPEFEAQVDALMMDPSSPRTAESKSGITPDMIAEQKKRGYPASRIPDLAKQQGLSVNETRKRLAAQGWKINEQE